jgi:DNA-binding XRE family transcriptional regulator
MSNFLSDTKEKMSQTTITPSQVRAARALVDWNQGDLARAANVSRQTVNDFETGKRLPIPNNMQAIVQALEFAGLTFIEEGDSAGAGVRLSFPASAAPDPQARLETLWERSGGGKRR